MILPVTHLGVTEHPFFYGGKCIHSVTCLASSRGPAPSYLGVGT